MSGFDIVDPVDARSLVVMISIIVRSSLIAALTAFIACCYMKAKTGSYPHINLNFKEKDMKVSMKLVVWNCVVFCLMLGGYWVSEVFSPDRIPLGLPVILTGLSMIVISFMPKQVPRRLLGAFIASALLIFSSLCLGIVLSQMPVLPLMVMFAISTVATCAASVLCIVSGMKGAGWGKILVFQMALPVFIVLSVFSIEQDWAMCFKILSMGGGMVSPFVLRSLLKLEMEIVEG